VDQDDEHVPWELGPELVRCAQPEPHHPKTRQDGATYPDSKPTTTTRAPWRACCIAATARS